MLEIYYGRENLNKSKFIFDNIKGDTILIVPDQYTLEAEKDGFKYLKTKGLMGVEVLSFSRLKDRVFSELGIRNLTSIDKRGRQMLLSKVLGEVKDDLNIYARYHSSYSFINLANNMISELKQYGVTPAELEEISREYDGSTLLKRKLQDMQKIFTIYEEEIAGHYVDTEDIQELFCRSIKDSDFVKNNTFWIFGFDVFSPKNLIAIEELLRYSKGVKVMLTYSKGSFDDGLFKVTSDTVDRLTKAAENANKKVKMIPVPQSYRDVKPESIGHLEKNLYALPYEELKNSKRIRFVKAANWFNEAESAAAYILKLVREKNYRFKDFLVLCNDLTGRGSIFKRVFESYGIKVFPDKKRSILYTPGAQFTLALLKVISDGYKCEDVISLLKTGLMDIADSDIWDLENYTTEYAINGSKWKNPFSKGMKKYSTEEMEKLESLRISAMDKISRFHERYKEKRHVEGKVGILYEFLKEMGIRERLEMFSENLLKEENFEEAEEIRQSWEQLILVMEQLVEITGDRTISARDFYNLFRTGLESVEIGIIPPSTDVVTMGTMQRTRTSNVKVMLVVGANEGVLPKTGDDNDIFSEEEKEKILNVTGREIIRRGELKNQEEKMAIYKNLSKAEDELYISYSLSSINGEEERPSMIFSKMRKIFSDATVFEDIISMENPKLLVGSKESTMHHLTEHLTDVEQLNEVWKEALCWYQDNEPEIADRIKESLEFNNVVNRPEKDLITRIFNMENGELLLSASRLEEYSKCPFRYFIHNGLKPVEQETYEVGNTEIGSIAHNTMQQLVNRFFKGGKEVTDSDSMWMTVTREELDSVIDEIVDNQGEYYSEGLLRENSTNLYRLDRAKKLCKDSAHYIVSHIRRGKISRIYTEYEFARKRELKPIIIRGKDCNIVIEGRIDRLDLLPGGIAKVIDYKTGNSKLDMDEVRAALSLQLVLYLRAIEENGMKIGGAYYFPISDMLRKENESVDEIYKMDGVSCLTDELINCMDMEEGQKTKVAEIGNAKKSSMQPEDFDAFMEDINTKIDEMCLNIEKGEIRIRPKKLDQKTGCDFCQYRGICKFDTDFSGNKYEYCR